MSICQLLMFSLFIRTPISLIEAWANGLPCLISDAVPTDAIMTDLVEALPLEDSSPWVDRLSNMTRKHSETYAERVNLAGCGINTAMESLYEM